MNLNNQRILLTGASRGIGFAIAQELARHGARLFIMARDENRTMSACEKLAQSGAKVSCKAIDISDLRSIAPAIQKAIEAMGGIDILINNAAITTQQMVVDQNMSLVEKEMRVNYLGVYAATQAVLPTMLAQKGGMIVNIASTIGKVPSPTQANYCASKAAIIAFSEALRSEVEDQGVQVKVFIPGHTDTEMGNSIKLKTPQLMTAEAVAQDFIKALRSKAPEYICGGANRGIISISRMMPELARKIMKDIALSSFFA